MKWYAQMAAFKAMHNPRHVAAADRQTRAVVVLQHKLKDARRRLSSGVATSTTATPTTSPLLAAPPSATLPRTTLPDTALLPVSRVTPEDPLGSEAASRMAAADLLVAEAGNAAVVAESQGLGQELLAAQRALQERGAEVKRLSAEVALLRGSVEAERMRLHVGTGKMANLAAQVEGLRADVRAREADVAALQATAAAHGAAQAQAAEAAAGLRRELADAGARLEAQDSEVAVLKMAVDIEVGKSDHLLMQLEAERKMHGDAAGTKTSLQAQVTSLEEGLAAKEAAVKSAEADSQVLQQKMVALVAREDSVAVQEHESAQIGAMAGHLLLSFHAAVGESKKAEVCHVHRSTACVDDAAAAAACGSTLHTGMHGATPRTSVVL
jgi:hypothetical protein